MDMAQVCDRLRGQETCAFHKEHKITSLCKTCVILVCLECMMSSEHEGHTFKNITSCLHEPTLNLAKHITEIEKRLLKNVEKELSDTKKQRTESVQKHNSGVEQLKEQRQQAHLQIDANADSMLVKWDEHSQKVLDVLDKHIQGLESLRNQLNEERKECSEILEKGSNILKYDAGLEIPKKTKMTRIPKPPNISELEYNKCDLNFGEFLLKAMGILEEVRPTPDVAELPGKSETPIYEQAEHHQYHLIESISNTYIKSPRFIAVAPVGKDVAWARESIYDEKNDKYLCSNMLYLIGSSSSIVQKIKLDTNIYRLQTHPISRQLFCSNDRYRSVRSIDTTTGKTTKIVKCEIEFHRMKVTHDNHVIVGSQVSIDSIYKYKLTGDLMNKSSDKFKVQDIDNCPQTNRVAIARGGKGLSLLNSDLTIVQTYIMRNGFCRSAIFDSHGNLIVADYSNKEIIVLDGGNLNFIQKLEIDGISSPAKLKLFDNVIWVDCNEPDKLICARIT